MDYKKKISNSGIAFKIKNISKQIFSRWLENAKEVYNLSPELLNRIKDDEVEDTFLDHLEIAIKALVEDKSDEKNKTKLLTSSTDPNLFKGICESIWSLTSSVNWSVIFVLINPGAIALTFIFLDATSFAIDFVKPITPAFDAA